MAACRVFLTSAAIVMLLGLVAADVRPHRQASYGGYKVLRITPENGVRLGLTSQLSNLGKH